MDNDYTQEMKELQAQIDTLVEAEANPKEIAELEMQLQVLKALYDQARSLFAAGEGDAELRQQLALHGYGNWTLDNVYAFVFESATELPEDGHHAFVSAIREIDFVALLN